MILVPCHRVIGKNNTLTGYKFGINRKEKVFIRFRTKSQIFCKYLSNVYEIATNVFKRFLRYLS